MGGVPPTYFSAALGNRVRYGIQTFEGYLNSSRLTPQQTDFWAISRFKSASGRDIINRAAVARGERSSKI